MNYEAAHKTFPHESTADQRFDEDQFETYRTLGLHSADLMAQQLATELARIAAAA